MKKLILFFLFFVLVLSASAQELIIVVGAGLSKTDSTAKSNYGFAQARLMFALTPGLRVGPYVGYTQYSNTELFKTPNPALLGKELSYGLSFDSYGRASYSHTYYFWANTGLKNIRDEFSDGTFSSTTKTKEFFVAGGFILTDEWLGWFGNNKLMVEYQKPLSSNLTGTWKGEKVPNLKAYDKESLRIVAESGIKRFGEKVSIEPLIHLGYGNNFTKNQYWEAGGGIGIGTFKDYYRDIMKLKVFHRENFSDGRSSICGEIVFNLSSFVQALKTNK